MKLILSTYAYYPYASGGTEVYTREMAKYFSRFGHELLVLAGWNGESKAFEDLIWDDEEVKAGRYQDCGVQVVGIHLKKQTIDSVYSNEKQAWFSVFTALFKKLEWDSPDILIMNGVSTVSGISLFKALRGLHPAVKLSIIMHTPFLCAKANMMFARTGRRCDANITPGTCAACVTATATGLPVAASRVLNKIVNSNLFSSIKSAIFSQHRLLQLKISGLKWLGEEAEHWIVFSDDMRLFLQKQQFIATNKVRMIRHGIDKKTFYPPSEKPPLFPSTFLYAGRFEAIKGVSLLCDAWKLLPESDGLRRLYLVGNWQETAVGRQLHATLGRRGDVIFMKPLTQMEMADLYREVHCVVVPSQWVETGPLVIHEAIECGCDVITTNIGGQAELAGWYAGKSQTFHLHDKEGLAGLIMNYQPSAVAPEHSPSAHILHFQTVSKLLGITG